MAASFVGLFFLLIALLVVVGLIVGIVLWATSGGGKGDGGMSCGSCGYAVRGLTQYNCPECGADLREVGIKKVGSPGRRTTGMVLTIACGSLCLMGCGLTAIGFVGFKSSSGSHTIHSTGVQTITVPQSQSGVILDAEQDLEVAPPEDGADVEGAGEDVPSDGSP